MTITILLSDVNANFLNQEIINAAKDGNDEKVKNLLQNEEINVNAYENKWWKKKTALIIASEKDHEEIAKILLQDKRIDINAIDDDHKTALIKASEMAKKLLSNYF